MRTMVAALMVGPVQARASISIGDERTEGRIARLRTANLANILMVRNGMLDVSFCAAKLCNAVDGLLAGPPPHLLYSPSVVHFIKFHQDTTVFSHSQRPTIAFYLLITPEIFS